MTGLEKSPTAAGACGSGSAPSRRGRAGVRLLGVLLLALGLGLGYVGIFSGLYEPLVDASRGVIKVEYCTHHDAKKSNGRECHGSYIGEEDRQRALVAVVETDEAYPEGHEISVVRVGDSSYFTSVTDAVASGLRYFFGGLCAVGPALFCIVTGRWPVPQSAGALRTLHPAFSWFTFPLVGLGILGVIAMSVLDWAV